MSAVSVSVGDVLPGELLDLHIRCVEAKELRNVQMMGKMDPYMNVAVGGAGAVVEKGPVAANQHDTPKWDWKTVKKCNVSDELRLVVMNKSALGSDEVVGGVILPVAQFVHGGVVDTWLALDEKGKPAGQLHVRIQLMHAGERPIAHAAPAVAATAAAPAAPVVPVAPVAPVHPVVAPPAYHPDAGVAAVTAGVAGVAVGAPHPGHPVAVHVTTGHVVATGGVSHGGASASSSHGGKKDKKDKKDKKEKKDKKDKKSKKDGGSSSDSSDSSDSD